MCRQLSQCGRNTIKVSSISQSGASNQSRWIFNEKRGGIQVDEMRGGIQANRTVFLGPEQEMVWSAGQRAEIQRETVGYHGLGSHAVTSRKLPIPPIISVTVFSPYYSHHTFPLQLQSKG